MTTTDELTDDQIDDLQASLEDGNNRIGDWNKLCNQAKRNIKIAAMKKDAERYQWLRDKRLSAMRGVLFSQAMGWKPEQLSTEQIDAAIDTCIDAARGKPKDEIVAALHAAEQPSREAVLEEKPAAWIEHHKGGDNLNWERVDHPYAKATPLFRALKAPPAEPAARKLGHPDDRSGSLPQGTFVNTLDPLGQHDIAYIPYPAAAPTPRTAALRLAMTDPKWVFDHEPLTAALAHADRLESELAAAMDENEKLRSEIRHLRRQQEKATYGILP